LKAEKKQELKEAKQHRSEFYYGSFKRVLTVPENIEVDKIKAEYKKGILSLTLPKNKAKENLKKIPVNFKAS